MSVNTWYRCITPARLEQLVEEARHDPDAPANYLHPENEGDDYERPEPGLWTERNWLGLHSLLTLDGWAGQPLLGEAIVGGVPIGGDYCYAESPVRYFTAERVRDMAPALQAVKEEALRDSCDPVALSCSERRRRTARRLAGRRFCSSVGNIQQHPQLLPYSTGTRLRRAGLPLLNTRRE